MQHARSMASYLHDVVDGQGDWRSAAVPTNASAWVSTFHDASSGLPLGALTTNRVTDYNDLDPLARDERVAVHGRFVRTLMTHWRTSVDTLMAGVNADLRARNVSWCDRRSLVALHSAATQTAGTTAWNDPAMLDYCATEWVDVVGAPPAPDFRFGLPDCQACAAGEVSRNWVCQPCRPFDIVVGNACQPCPFDFVPSTARDTCVRCPDGEIADATTGTCRSCGAEVEWPADVCAPCPTGTVKDGPLAETCHACGVREVEVQHACQSCPTGEVQTPAGTACELCTADWLTLVGGDLSMCGWDRTRSVTVASGTFGTSAGGLGCAGVATLEYWGLGQLEALGLERIDVALTGSLPLADTFEHCGTMEVELASFGFDGAAWVPLGSPTTTRGEPDGSGACRFPGATFTLPAALLGLGISAVRVEVGIRSRSPSHALTFRATAAPDCATCSPLEVHSTPTTCTPCPPDTIPISATECAPCGDGYVRLVVGDVATCQACPSGTIEVAGRCEPCGVGMTSGAGSCVACSADVTLTLPPVPEDYCTWTDTLPVTGNGADACAAQFILDVAGYDEWLTSAVWDRPLEFVLDALAPCSDTALELLLLGQAPSSEWTTRRSVLVTPRPSPVAGICAWRESLDLTFNEVVGTPPSFADGIVTLRLVVRPALVSGATLTYRIGGGACEELPQ